MQNTFFMSFDPPVTTAQQKQVRIVNGKPIFYEPARLKAARKLITDHLIPFRPEQPYSGPLSLTAEWYFPAGSGHKDGDWRISRPDTDNLQKMLKDCMTDCGFWHDDAQVVREIAEKKWVATDSGILITIISL